MTNLENLKKLAESLGADASGAETNAEAIGVVAEASKKITEKIDLSGFGRLSKLCEDTVDDSFAGGTFSTESFDVTNVSKITVTLKAVLKTEGATYTIAPYLTPDDNKSPSGNVWAGSNITQATSEQTYEIDCTNLTGNYCITVAGGGNAPFRVEINELYSVANIPSPVTNVVDALNYLLSLHN